MRAVVTSPGYQVTDEKSCIEKGYGRMFCLGLARNCYGGVIV